MKKFLSYIVFIAFISVLPFQSWSQSTLKKIIASGELKVGMTLQQPPFSMKSKHGVAMGFEVEIAEALAQSMNLRLKIVELPFHELLSSLESGKVDAVMSGMTITAERNTKVLFAGPYLISGKSILTKSKTLALADETADINKKEFRFAAMKGSTSEKFAQMYLDLSSIQLVENYNDGIKLLLANEVDAMIADFPICALSQLRYPNDDLVSLNEPLTLEPIGMALPPNDPLLHNLVQNYLNSLMLSGLLDELENYWFDDPSWISDVENFQYKGPSPIGGNK